MKTKFAISLLLLLGSGSLLWGQSSYGTLSGQVFDSLTGNPIELVNVVLFQNDNQISGTATDDEGYFSISPIKPGKYTVGATYIGYKQFKIKDVVINGSRITKLDIQLANGDYTIPVTEIPIFKKELIPADIGGVGTVLIAEEIDRLPIESIVDIVDLTPGVINGEVHANRPGSSVYIVDGMKIRGDLAIAMGSVQEMRVLTGGIPAEYGDILGGVIIIETKNPLNQYYCFNNDKKKQKKQSK
jgi:hypothetical protein